MARVADHLSISDLEQRFRGCTDPVEARHVQAIWLLAQGHTVGWTSKVTAFGPRWIEQLLERYKYVRPRGLGQRAATQRPQAEPVDARGAGSGATAAGRAAARPWAVVEPQGGRGDGSPPRAGTRSALARLGGAESARLVIAAAAAQKPEVRHLRRGGRVQKGWQTLRPRRRPPIPASPSRCSAPTNTASA